VLSRFADVFDAVRDSATFSSAKGLTPDPDSMAMFEGRAAPIVMMDPPEHTTMRRLVSRPMTPRAVAALEPAISSFVDERLDVLEDDRGGDIVETLFKPFQLRSGALSRCTASRSNPLRWLDALHRGRRSIRRSGQRS